MKAEERMKFYENMKEGSI